MSVRNATSAGLFPLLMIKPFSGLAAGHCARPEQVGWACDGELISSFQVVHVLMLVDCCNQDSYRLPLQLIVAGSTARWSMAQDPRPGYAPRLFPAVILVLLHCCWAEKFESWQKRLCDILRFHEDVSPSIRDNGHLNASACRDVKIRMMIKFWCWPCVTTLQQISFFLCFGGIFLCIQSQYKAEMSAANTTTWKAF